MGIIIGKAFREEQKELIINTTITKMSVELNHMGVTAEQLLKDSRFSQLNKRFALDDNYQPLTIGSVLKATHYVLRELEILAEGLKKQEGEIA